ncbi:site-specific DNA-methyltransferase [Rhizobium sp. KVB221]|uniref:site-specific DNA-methyltransferase (adenine-specific) n=1 Tax=Rhizobium setariae TaxID=2801340 RepID=A0A936YTB8_9HYPH|nr:site-specific DNA-methyltransferase [Rhizobium setariae]MBL0372616.1 site-specific DNA-methyltransferase [Rhizobium setariae]
MPTLRWLTRDDDIRAGESVPYRLLEEVPDLGCGDRDTGNMLIRGDNLDALKALLPFYAGQVKCIFIDPPYNTRSAFEHYDDNLEHSQWLAMMWPRLELLRELLSEDGSIWVSIDDNEGHYLKVVMDEVFGRRNFVTTVIWHKMFSVKNSAQYFSEDHDYVSVFARNKDVWRPNELPRSEKQDAMYKNPDNDPRGLWTSGDFSARNFYGAGTYAITNPAGRVIAGPPPGMYWRFSKEKLAELDADNRIWWGKDGNGVPRLKRFLSEVKGGRVPQTIWQHAEVGHTQEAKKEVVALDANDVFTTPKPERLLQRVLTIATNPGDLVLDSFLGSGTTAAVAQKMGRRYIGIEMGDHAETHCQPRLQKVVDGEQGGISEAANWKGGGGFRFYRLGASVFDETGQIRPDIEFPVLAAHVWFSEVRFPWSKPDPLSPVLGVHDGRAYGLLYNGILGDKSVSGGNVLTRKTLAVIRDALPEGFAGPITVYGERSALSDVSLLHEQITFKQTPYDVKARA